MAEWHRAGLIPKPSKRGEGRGLGSASYYPSGSASQALVCAHLFDRGLSAADVGWGLWLRGFEVDEEFWRKPLKRAGVTVAVLLKAFKLKDPIDELPSLADETDDVISKAAQSSKKLSFLRRRLKGALIDLAAVAVSVLIGAFEWSDDEGSLSRTLGRLVGTVQPDKKTRRPGFTILPIDGETIADHLHHMSAAFRAAEIDQLMRDLQSDEIRSARDELLFLRRNFSAVAHEDAGPGLAVVHLLNRLLDLDHRNAGSLAIAIWLVVRDVPDWRERLATMKSALQLRGSAGALEGL